ncbi:hypothetical protein Q7P35_003782 [Cladosporium inversicolor]
MSPAAASKREMRSPDMDSEYDVNSRPRHHPHRPKNTVDITTALFMMRNSLLANTRILSPVPPGHSRARILQKPTWPAEPLYLPTLTLIHNDSYLHYSLEAWRDIGYVACDILRVVRRVATRDGDASPTLPGRDNTLNNRTCIAINTQGALAALLRRPVAAHVHAPSAANRHGCKTN